MPSLPEGSSDGRPALREAPNAVSALLDVNDEPDRAHGLARECALAEAGERPESLQPRGHISEGVRVQGSCAAVVPCVQGREEVLHLGAAALPENEPVGPHSQCLTHEAAQVDTAGALQVGLPRLEPYDDADGRPAVRRRPR